MDRYASVPKIAKELGTAWRAMSAEEKAPYEAMAREDRRRYKIGEESNELII